VDTVHECDGQTDRQTDRITITKTVQRIASHGKKLAYKTNLAAQFFMLRHRPVSCVLFLILIKFCGPKFLQPYEKVVKVHQTRQRLFTCMHW